MRERLRAAWSSGAAPDERTAALAGILQALDRLAPALGLKGADARDAKRRVKDLTEGDWAAKAVRDAVQAAISAVTTASVAATSAATCRQQLTALRRSGLRRRRGRSRGAVQRDDLVRARRRPTRGARPSRPPAAT